MQDLVFKISLLYELAVMECSSENKSTIGLKNGLFVTLR